MKVKYLGKTEKMILTNKKIYDVISIERGWYRLIPDVDDGELSSTGKPGALFPPKLFEIVEE